MSGFMWLELATADYIEVEWKSNEGSHTWTTGKKCKKKTHTDSSKCQRQEKKLFRQNKCQDRA